MVEINLNDSNYPETSLLIELNNAFSSSEVYSNFDLVNIGEFEFGSDDDEDEKVVLPSGFEMEFRVSPQTSQMLRKIYNLLTLYCTDVIVTKDSTVFFKGIVGRESVKMDLQNWTIKIKVDDLVQGYKNRDITGNPMGFNVTEGGINNPCYPIKYMLMKLVNNNHGTPFYTEFITDSTLRSEFTYLGNNYEVNLDGIDNFSDPDNLTYYSVWNKFYVNNPTEASPKTLIEMIKFLVNTVECVAVPGYSGKFFVLQRWKNPDKTPVVIDEDKIIDHDIKVIFSKEGISSKVGNVKIDPPPIECVFAYTEYGNVLKRDGSLVNSKAVEEYISFVVDNPWSSGGDSFTGMFASWNRAGYPDDVRYNLHAGINADTSTNDGLSTSTYCELVASLIYGVISNYRTNFKLKVHGINYALDSYYKLAIDYPPSTRVYRCRKIHYNFDENWTELDLISF